MILIFALIIWLIFLLLVIIPNLQDLENARRQRDTSTRQARSQDRANDDPYDPPIDVRVGRITYYHVGDDHYYELPGADEMHEVKR